MKKFWIWLKSMFRKSDIEVALYHSPKVVGRRTDGNDTVILSPYIDFRHESQR